MMEAQQVDGLAVGIIWVCIRDHCNIYHSRHHRRFLRHPVEAQVLHSRIRIVSHSRTVLCGLWRHSCRGADSAPATSGGID